MFFRRQYPRKSATSFPPRSDLMNTVIHIMPFNQAIQASMAAMPEPLMDLVLSGIAYFALMQALSLAVGNIAWVLFPADWTLHRISALLDWRNNFIWWMFLSLWAARFVLRWRGHLACAWGCFACILRWLSPLSPKPFDACPFCRKGIHGEASSGKDHQHEHEHELQPQPPRLISPPPLLAIPATAQEDQRSAVNVGNKLALPKFTLTDAERAAQREIGIFR